MNIFDAIRELRIRRHFWLAVGAKDPQKKSRHFKKMNALIRQRSEKQVHSMEVRKGLI